MGTGFEALLSNTTGINNTANGVNALFSNTGGQGNTASGFNALLFGLRGSERVISLQNRSGTEGISYENNTAYGQRPRRDGTAS